MDEQCVSRPATASPGPVLTGHHDLTRFPRTFPVTVGRIKRSTAPTSSFLKRSQAVTLLLRDPGYEFFDSQTVPFLTRDRPLTRV
jgi:hypothetical protein